MMKYFALYSTIYPFWYMPGLYYVTWSELTKMISMAFVYK